jgi:signal transduction histidine kinase
MSPAAFTLVGAAWTAAALATAVAFTVTLRQRRCAELIARAVHELRGPLGAARLGLHLIARHDASDHDRAAAIDLELRRAALALADLDAARSGCRAAERRQPIDIAELATRVAAAWRPVAQAAGGDLRLGPLAAAHVVGDRVRLAQAAGNLVANAIEHGATPIELRTVTDGKRVRFEVHDAGPGLPVPIATLSRGRRAGRGARGRGLAIAAAVAQRHGGRLASAPTATGARLVLELPCAGSESRVGARLG